MPTIGWFEILIIVVVAIIILGPKDFPLMLKKVGSWIGSVKRYVNNVQNEVSSITEDTIDKNLTEDINVNKKKVLLIDDLLATGGTINAAASLLQKSGAEVCCFISLIELTFLNGREKLNFPYQTLIKY